MIQRAEDANVLSGRLAGPGLKDALKKVPSLSPQQEAQELAYRAMEAPTHTRALTLAQQARAKDPDCVDALVTLAAASARSVEDLIAGLEKAVEVGERSLGAKCLEENKAISGACSKRGLTCSLGSNWPTYCWTPGA